MCVLVSVCVCHSVMSAVVHAHPVLPMGVFKSMTL